MTNVFAGFKDRSVPINTAGQETEVASLAVPAGKYFATAKLFLGPPGAGAPTNRSVRLELRAEGDFDRAQVTTDETIGTAMVGLQLVHEFAHDGRIVLVAQFMDPGTTTKSVSWAKITALAVDSIRNHPLS